MPLTKPKVNNLDTSIFKIDDPIISLNAGLNPANPNNSDIGLIFKRGTTGDNVAMMWDKSLNEFIFATTTSDSSAVGDLVYSGYADLRCNNVSSAISAPINIDHLTRKDYVDNTVANYLPLVGGTLDGGSY